MKKILIATGLATILASSAFACGCKNANMGMGCQMSQMGIQQNKPSEKLLNRILHAFAKTAPTTEQITKAKEAMATFEETMDKLIANKKFPLETLQDDKFDKNLFASICLEKSAQKLQAKADLIDAIYSMLDEKQKREFKTSFAKKQILKELMY